MSYPEKPIPESYISSEEEYEESTPSLLDDGDTVEYDVTAEF